MSFLIRAVYLGVLLLASAALPQFAAAKTILVIAPHPDDEALIAAGRIRAAVLAGDTVKIIVVTNGDAQLGGVDRGLQREGESVAAAQLLGLTEQDVIFLGYPDGSMLDIYNAPSPTDIITSAAGQTSTYGNRGLGGIDFHTYWYGSAGPYNHVTVAGDIQTMQTQLEWKRLLRSVVPAVPAKCQVLSQYGSITPHLLSFARKDEFFWMSDFGANLAITAQVTVSSENTANNQGGLKAVDGVIDGAPHDPAREWVTLNELAGAWIQLGWPSSVSIAQVNLYDRPHWAENIL